MYPYARWSIYLKSYDFEIIHRKGSIHNNVDTLNCLVLSIEIVTKKEVDLNLYAKTLDTFEDDDLLQYLRFKT